jgi:hypothetical protein
MLGAVRTAPSIHRLVFTNPASTMIHLPEDPPEACRSSCGETCSRIRATALVFPQRAHPIGL